MAMQIFNYFDLISFGRLILLLDKETLRLLADNPRVCGIIIYDSCASLSQN